MAALERALASWDVAGTAAETSPALDAADRDVFASTRAARALVLELFVSSSTRDLFNACAWLGGLMGAAGASPSLAASVIDGAAEALVSVGAAIAHERLLPARAACLEGYVAAVRDREEARARGGWAYPACVVPFAADAVAIACGIPAEGEELTAWAEEIARRLGKRGVKRAVLAGKDAARAELESALALVGIEVARTGRESGEARETANANANANAKKSWFARLLKS